MSVKLDLIDDLMLANHIAISDVVTYYKNNKSQIDNMMDIFEEKKSADFDMISAIPLLIDTDNSETIQDFYYSELGDNNKLEQYKLPLITAMLYNNKFFVHACNWCSYALYQAEISVNSTDILKVTWEDLNINNQFVYAQAAAFDDYVQVYPSSADVESNLLVYWYEAEKTMQFVYTFDENYKEKHASIKIECKGLLDLDGNELTTIIIDSDLNELNEISIKKQVNFTKDFEILKVYIKK